MTCVTYQKHQMYPLSETPKVFVLRTQQLERLDVRTYAFMLDTDPTLWEQFETRKLGEICHTFLGATPKDANADEGNGVAFLKTKNVYADNLDLSDVDYITEQAHKTTRKSSALKNGDILMTIIGASFEVIGRCLVYRGQPEPANINQNVIGIRIKDGINLDPDFLCLQLNTQYGQMQVGQKAQRTAQFSLNKGIVEDFDVIIPKTIDQKNILDRFNTIKMFCEKIREHSQTIKEESESAFSKVLEAIEEVISHEFPSPWYGRYFLLKKDDQIDRLDVLGSNLNFEKSCEVSNKYVNLSDLCHVDDSNSALQPGQYRYLSIENAPGNWWDAVFPDDQDIDVAKQASSFSRGDIAFSNLKPSILKGKCFILDEDCYGSPNYIALRTKGAPKMVREFLWTYLKLPVIRRFIANKCTGKSESQKVVNGTILSAVPVPKLSADDYKVIGLKIEEAKKVWFDRKAEAEALDKTSQKISKEAADNIFELLDDEKYQLLMRHAEEALQ